MHPWRGRSRPAQPNLPIRDPDSVIGDRHPQMVACEAFLGRPVRRFDGLSAEATPVSHTWSEAWRTHFESLPEYGENLLRGQSFIDNGRIWHLEIERGHIRGIVLGSQLYAQHVVVAPLGPDRERALIEACRDRVANAEDMLAGRLPASVLSALTDPQNGLLPGPDEIELSCSCPEGSGFCQHLAAILLATARRLEERPQLLFVLRGTTPEVLKGLLPAGLSRPPPPPERLLSIEDIDTVFDLRLDRPSAEPETQPETKREDPLDIFLGKRTDPEPDAEPEPEPEPELAPPPAQSAIDASWLDDDWDEDEEDEEEETNPEIFGGPGPSPVTVSAEDNGEGVLEVDRSDLIELGIPSHRIQRWLSNGTLIRTEARGRYQLTQDAWAAIEPLLPSD